MQTRSTSSAATERLGERLGCNLRGGEVIELVSDLGGGKTTFVRGLARGLGSRDHVSSPTYTISHEYHVKGSTFHTLLHFDFYRLSEAGVVAHELAEVVGDKNIIVVVEWADIVRGVLPPERLTIHIKTTGELTREFSFECPVSLSYSLKGLS